MILDHYQRFGGDGERFSAVECCGTDEYLYPGLVGKKLFSCTIFANISIWEAVLLQIKFKKKCIWGVGWKSCW